MKFFLFGLLMLSMPCPGLLAQTMSGDNPNGSGGLETSAGSPTPASGKKKPGAAASATPAQPTIIDATEGMDYDGKARVAIYKGEDYGVHVQDPQFVVFCDKFTAYLRKAAPPGAKASATPTPTPTPAATRKGKKGTDDGTSSKANSIQRGVADGALYRPVVIVQDRPGANGAAPVHNVGIAAKADYNGDTGDVMLTGWPRVSQGKDIQIATAEYTVMTMNKDGQTMTTHGPSRTVIQPEEQPKKTGTNAESPDQSPSPSP